MTHIHKTVRKQFVDLSLPPAPADDVETFVLRFRGQHSSTPQQIELAPSDFHQYVACLIQVQKDAGMIPATEPDDLLRV